MDLGSNKTSSRIGRRPVKQGPRSLSSNQDRVEKSVTGRTTFSLRSQLRIGTWNVRSMLQLGKLQILESEMERLRMDICGLAEVRWKGQGHFVTTSGNTVVYSGQKEQGRHGVAIWIRQKIATALIGYEPINDRMMLIKLAAVPNNLTVVQVYAPTSAADEDSIETFYKDLSGLLKKMPKHDIWMVIGDCNAKVGTERDSSGVVGPYGLGELNERGERLKEFCVDHDLVIMNTWFQQHPRRLYTWTAPDRKTRNQIDYIMVPQRWKLSVSSCKTFPGADCDSDHSLLAAALKFKYKRKIKPIRVQRLNIEELEGDKAVHYAVSVKNRFEALQDVEEENTPDMLWQTTKTVLIDTAKEIVGYVDTRQKRKTWITDETFSVIRAKREAKSTDALKYKELKAEVQRKLRQDKQQQLNAVCDELEAANQKGDMRQVFRLAKTVTRKFQPSLHCIKSASGENITEDIHIAARWKEYCEELYTGDPVSVDVESRFQQSPREPPPLRSEIERAIRHTANRKSTGPDGVPVELFKAGGETTVDRLHRICTGMWESGEWPEDWTESIFIPLPKKVT